MRQVDVVDSIMDVWFWGLTCEFWAENAKTKIAARATTVDSVSWDF